MWNLFSYISGQTLSTVHQCYECSNAADINECNKITTCQQDEVYIFYTFYQNAEKRPVLFLKYKRKVRCTFRLTGHSYVFKPVTINVFLLRQNLKKRLVQTNIPEHTREESKACRPVTSAMSITLVLYRWTRSCLWRDKAPSI